MLTQQINLYKFLPRAPKFVLKRSTIWLSYAAFFILLMLDYSHLAWTHHKNKATLAKINNELTQKKNELANLMLKYPIFNEKDLASSVLQMKEQFSTRLKILSLLMPGAKFSSYLIAFAKVIPKEVWLTEILISNIEQKMTLSGYAIRALPIQNYLDLLAKEPAFSGVIFGLQELIEAPLYKDKKPSYISFHASSKATVIQ